MTKLLSDEELQNWLVEHTQLIEETGGAVWRELEVETFMYHFKDLINTQQRLYAESVKDKKLYVPSLTEETYKYLKALHDPYMYGDRAYYSYKHLADRAELSIERCKELTKLFKVLGLVESKRGLMTEDGEVYGSGIGIPYGNQETVAECAILRYENELRAEQRSRINEK